MMMMMMMICVVYHSTTNREFANTSFRGHMQSDLDMLLAKKPNILFIITGNFNPTTTVFHLKDLINFNHLKQNGQS